MVRHQQGGRPVHLLMSMGIPAIHQGQAFVGRRYSVGRGASIGLLVVLSQGDSGEVATGVVIG